MKKIKDSKIALITGACGGIGKALVHKYASQNITPVSYTHLTLPTN